MPVNPTRPSRLTALLLAIALGVPGVAGCSSPPSLETRAKRMPIDIDTYARLGYRLDWRGFPTISARGDRVEFLDIHPDVIAVQETGGRVSGLDAATGRQRWSVDLATPLTNFVGISRVGTTFLVASDTDLYLVDAATGNAAGRQELEKVVSTAPDAADANLVLFATALGEVYGHVLRPGVRVWGHQISGAIRTNPVRVGPTVSAVSQTGEVVFLALPDGQLIGKNRIFDGVQAGPVTDGRLVFIASLDQSLYAFDPTTAALVWRYRTPARLTDRPAAHAGSVYVSVPGQGFHCLNADTGEVRWKAPGVTGEPVGLAKGRLLVWDGQDAVLIEPDTGAVVDRVRLPNVVRLEMDGFDGGPLYAVSKEAVVARLVPAL